MVRRVLILAGWFFLVSAGNGRIFRDQTGRAIEARLLSATDTEVVVQIKKTGRVHRLQLDVFSDQDRDYIKKWRDEVRLTSQGKAAEMKRETRAILGAQELVSFVKKSKGLRIGNGECWTLADEAFKKAGIKRPGKAIRVWGRLLDWQKESVLPGDILELRSAKFSGGMSSGPEHTAVVIEAGRRKGVMVVYHQNWGAAGKTVSQATFNLENLEEGEAMVYRYEGREPEED